MSGSKDPANMRDMLSDLDEGRTDPVRISQQAMRAPLPKRFYKQAAVVERTDAQDHPYGVELDGKPVRTPAGNVLAFPTSGAAQLVADEFAAQETEIDPARMPATRLSNTALDGVANDRQAVREDILRFAATDLLCYRAGSPAELVERQNALWDPFIDWLRDDLGVNLVLAEGVMHVGQPREAIAAFGVALRQFHTAYELTCLHICTTLTGSAALALALARGFAGPDTVWRAAHVDEDWNISQWGEDAEAAARRAQRHDDFIAATCMLAAVRGE